MSVTCRSWLGAVLLSFSGLIFLITPPTWAETYEYDDLNRMTKIIYESGDYIEYEYDAAGNLVGMYSPDMTPVAVDDTATVTEDAPATTIDVLDNDTDIDGGPKSIASVTQPANGTVAITNGGADLTYQPAPDYCNDGASTDDFTYTLAPGGATATVRVTVQCVNDPPACTDDNAITDEDTPVIIAVTSNDNAGPSNEEQSLTISEITGPSHGIASYNGNGTVTYTPEIDYFGTDSFTYTISDSGGLADTATVTVTVNPLNDPPVCADDSGITDEDTSVTINVVSNDNGGPPNEDQTLTIISITQGSHGTVNSVDGALTYTPNPDWNGVDSCSYTIQDSEGLTDTATVTITVAPVNDPPEVTVDTESQTVQYSDGISAITIDSSDIDSSTLTISTSWTKDGGAPHPGLPSGMTMNTDDCTGAASVSCSRAIEGRASVPEGTYGITVMFSDGEYNVEVITTVIVEPEDTSISFDGDNPVAVQVASPGGNSGSFGLTVHLKEMIPDEATAAAYAGEISLAVVSMSLVPVGPGGSSTGACAVDSVVGSGYEAVLTATCTFSDVAVNTYTASVTISGGYYDGSSEDVLVVYDPSLGFATGGGWFYWPGTGDKTNFGFNMKYNQKGTNVQGSLLLIRHMPEGTIYRIKSNALYGLALGEANDGEGYGWASFSGKSTYLEPGWPDPIGNYEFVAYVEDRNEPGTGVDRVWIQVKDKDGNLVGAMSLASPATNNIEEIRGGNIVVPHR